MHHAILCAVSWTVKYLKFTPPVPSRLLTDILMAKHVGSFLKIFLILFQMLPDPTPWNFKHRTLSLALLSKMMVTQILAI